MERFAEQVEKRLEARLAESRPHDIMRRGPDNAVTMVSLGVAIPLMAIAGGTAGLAGIVAVCLALVLVNVVVRRF